MSETYAIVRRSIASAKRGRKSWERRRGSGESEMRGWRRGGEKKKWKGRESEQEF